MHLTPTRRTRDDSRGSHGGRSTRSDSGHGAADDGSGALTDVRDDRTRGSGEPKRRRRTGDDGIGDDTNFGGGISINTGNDGRR